MQSMARTLRAYVTSKDSKPVALSKLVELPSSKVPLPGVNEVLRVTGPSTLPLLQTAPRDPISSVSWPTPDVKSSALTVHSVMNPPVQHAWVEHA